MPLSYVVSTTSNAASITATSATSGCVWLYHGSRQQMIDSIVTHGIDEVQAKLCGADGSFWASTHYTDALGYAQKPPYDRGDPSALGFQVPTMMLDHFLQQAPPWAREYYLQGWYRFYKQSFPVLTTEMKNVTMFKNITMNVEM